MTGSVGSEEHQPPVAARGVTHETDLPRDPVRIRLLGQHRLVVRARAAQVGVEGHDRSLGPKRRDLQPVGSQPLNEAAVELQRSGVAAQMGWRDVVGMRNVLTHHYWRTDSQVVHDTVTHDLPALATEVTRLLDELT